ncbi:zinc-dependent metalloprotease [Polaribacter litorisediminis]|uniref:zinc-dependent metalloprotease n=1 Tax=Polaribacter litorisediminis TaxID=1908341 RepID=UPI001CBD2A15|nr:zinc-dependent metalloprotease [Polaribacter litorisediminis]UAM98593.1 zinc-dependent metalloprotease [Polaribacter litorisediminis]
MKTLKSRELRIFCSLFLTLAIAGIQDSNAQFWKKEKKKEQTSKPAPKPKKKEKSIADLTKSSKKIEGLFTIFQDTITGDVKLLVKEDQLDKDFIYFAQIADGVTEANAYRGSYKGSSVFHINKYFNKLDFIAPNTSFYFDKDSPLAKAAEANISDAVIASGKILASDDEKGEHLIDATGLFLSETFITIKSPRRPGQSPFSFSLGRFDKAKSKINAIKNYPENTNVKTEYVYNNPTVLNGGSAAITDGRNVSIKVFHTFMNMPEEGYDVRMDDARVGYFLTETNDMTTTETINYRDMIHRWRLVKKDPSAKLSEPVTPITWWIENTTPLEWRETIKEGVLAWNIAFEKAGFKNAMVVKVQPNDADWDAGDVRYNVLRWTSSPNPPFGGYGPSFVNPRTGEILGSDIMLEFVHFTNRVFADKLYNSAASNMKVATLEELEAEKYTQKGNHMYCSAGHIMHENLQLGTAVLQASGASDLEMEAIKKEGMKSLIMHEVGHTLGLNHNMKASQLFSPEQLADADFIKGKALTGSVMDYAGINITNDRSKQGQYYDMSVGPYDVWAIQFGYTPFSNESEKDALLEKSTEPQLIFGNDADDMRSPGKAIDPRVMIGDLSNDPITYSMNRFELVNAMMKELKPKFLKEGETYEDLRRAYNTLHSQTRIAGGVVSRFIGGVYVDRATFGQEGGTQPYTPVSLSDQKRAMSALKKYIFAPDAFDTPNDVYNYLAKQRRGYNFFGGPEDPKIHEQVLSYQTSILAHLMHPNTLQRVSNSALYGNEYKLETFMSDLNNMMFKPDVYGSINSFRQNLQAVYTKRLIDMITGKASNRFSIASKSMAIYNLNTIKKWVSNGTGDLATKAHKNHLKTLITNAMKEIK